MNSRLASFMLTAALIQHSLSADTLRLKDGTSIQGTMIEADTHTVTLSRRMVIPRSTR